MTDALRKEASRRAGAVAALANEDEDDSDEDEGYTSFAPPGVGMARERAEQKQQRPPPDIPFERRQQHYDPNSTAELARREWRNHGVGVSQMLEEKRTAHPGLIVRIISAEPRTDLSGATYTAFIIQVSRDFEKSQIEHRYSDFDKLQRVLDKHHVQLDDAAAVFPRKHWAGRLGQWTPSLSWAPDQHDELVNYRIIQLDVWLVHVVSLYNSNQLPDVVRAAVHDFLTQNMRQKSPCDVPNDDLERDKWKWNNPLSFTLGSAIRQATYTIQYMVNTGSVGDQSIPLDLLQAAQGLCFLTVLKAGMVVSGRVGTGLVVARLDDNVGKVVLKDQQVRWSAPTAVGTVGMGWGALIGGDVTHYLIVLTTTKAVRDCVSSSSCALGAELGVAVGPIGRGATSSVRTGDWTLHPAYAYAHSQGFFVGMSLEGSVMNVRSDVNAKFYGRTCTGQDLLQQAGCVAAEPLYQALNKALHLEIPDGAFRPTQFLSPKSGKPQQARLVNHGLFAAATLSSSSTPPPPASNSGGGGEGHSSSRNHDAAQTPTWSSIVSGSTDGVQ